MAEEVEPAIVKKTQEILSGVIKKPPLTEKNLKRPPFRFLHDVITNVIKSTGFMKGLYSTEEMSSENIKDKESKMAYLQKAIDLIVLVTDTPINLKPTKVVAGHEVKKTNEFLQILGLAAKSKIDTKEAVAAVLQKSNIKDRKDSMDKRPKNAAEKSHLRSTTKTLDPAKKTPQGSTSKESKTKETEKSRSRSKDSKVRDKDKTKEKTRSKREDSKNRDSKKDRVSGTSKDAKQPSEESPRKKQPSSLVQNGFSDDIDNVNDTVDVEEDGNLAFPSSPQFSSPLKGHRSSTIVDNGEPTQPVEAPRQEEKPQPFQTRPPSARTKRTKAEPASARLKNGPSVLNASGDGSLSPMPRPPSARPSSSRPAPPRIRIRHIVENDEPSIRPETAKPVENVIVDQKLDGDEDEDDTFIVTEEPVTDALEPPVMVSSTLRETPDEDKGSLVKQLLETKKDLEGGSQMVSKKVEIDKSQLASKRTREASSKELEQLQSFIQSVSKTAYPLGRMLDYMQEDMDSMKMELRMWREEHKQNLTALRKEKSTTESILEPLRVQLDDLDQMVQDQIDANSALKANIFRNEDRIQRMLAAIQRKS